MKKVLYICIPLVVLILFLSRPQGGVFFSGESQTDLPQIEKKGSMVVAINKNSSDYFLYKGEPMGFQLEVLEDLGSYLGLKIEVIVCNNSEEMIDFLHNGKCDMVAGTLSYSDSTESNRSYTIPLVESDLVLVQRYRKSETGTNSVVKKLSEMKGMTLCLPSLSPQTNLRRDLKGIQVVEMPQYTADKLVELVANGTIDYTICTSILAENLHNQYPWVNFSTVAKKACPALWVFRKSSVLLSTKVNDWANDFKKSTRFSVLLDKYYNSQNKWADARNRYFVMSGNKISEFDELIKKYSKDIKWDWRLLASLICQESRFVPNVKSHRGAYGLMQLMPSTLERFGIDTTATPEEQIKAGVKFIKFLDKSLAGKVFDPMERINFILASYNIGPGHVFDAQRLATKLGKNPQKWFNNVDTCLLSKSDPKNYNDPQVEFGYCKGLETFSFVHEVLDRYLHYKNVIAQ